MDDFEEIPGFRGATRWYRRGGHFFVAFRQSGLSTYLRCHSNRCPVTWVLRAGQPGPIQGEHDHDPTPWVRNRNNLFQALKRRASSEATPLNAIYEEEAARYPDAVPYLLYESVVSSMRTWRRSVVPPVPRTLEAYGVALAEHPTYSNLLLGTVSAGGASAIILIMPNFIACLQASETVVVDGTFLTVPAGLPAAQILTLHAVIAGHSFHPVIVLMQNRRRLLYEAVLLRVWQAAGNPRPVHIVTDYEQALQRALQSVTNVPVSGCLFHLFQALLRQARRQGIPAAHRNTAGYKLVQLYAALAYLPADRIALGLAEVPAIAAERGLPYNEEFHNYFVAQWMVREGPERISVYQRPHRTSNVAESFHASLRRSLSGNPNVWRFTEIIQQKMAVTAARFEAQGLGRLVRRNRERSYINNNILNSNIRSLDRGLISLRQFLTATSQLLDVNVEVVAAEDVPEVAVEVILGEDHLFAPAAAPPSPPPVELLVPPPPPVEPLVPPPPPVEPLVPQPPPVELILPPPVEPMLPPPPPVEPAAEPAVLAVCRICWESAPNTALIPCGHLICTDCLNSLQQAQQLEYNEHTCPFCRSPIVRTLRIFM